MTKVKTNGEHSATISAKNEHSSSTIIISSDQSDIFSDIIEEDANRPIKQQRKPYTKRIKEPTCISNLPPSNRESSNGAEKKSKDIRALKREHEALNDRQCYGPDCTRAAEKESKYCSSECGYELAKHRLNQILKARVLDYYRVPSVSEKQDEKKILLLNLKKAGVERKLEVANSFSSTINSYLLQVSNLTPKDAQPSSSNADMDISIFCILCGLELSSLSGYQVHINLCWMKTQRRFAYCSKLPADESSLVCNTFIPSIKVYCRRLRFACSEHLKTSKSSRICGYPLKLSVGNGGSSRVEDMFSLGIKELISKGICMEQQKACVCHLGWETNMRAILDNHRVSLSSCLERISAEYHELQKTYGTRGDALTLLSNWRQMSEETSEKEELYCKKRKLVESMV